MLRDENQTSCRPENGDWFTLHSPGSFRFWVFRISRGIAKCLGGSCTPQTRATTRVAPYIWCQPFEFPKNLSFLIRVSKVGETAVSISVSTWQHPCAAATSAPKSKRSLTRQNSFVILRKTFAQTFYIRLEALLITTIRDVARQAGVSISTVSHVVNSSRAVSQESRDRVLQAMNQLDYKPNALAQNLRRQQTFSIGMIVPDSANPFFAEVARGIEDTSFTQNHSVILCNTDGDVDKQAAHTDLLIKNQVAGILFVAAGISTELVEDLQARRVPVVVVDREVPGVSVDTVLTNHLQGGRLATQHLWDLGHRRIACISGGSNLSPSAERLIGYQQILHENGILYDESLVVRGDFQYVSGYEAARQLLALADPPTAVFACNDLMAVGVISAVTELGLRVPQDLSVVGFDDVRLASFTNPPLTTIAQPKYEIGVIATEMLLARAQNIDAPTRLQRLDTELVIRQSTAPLLKE